MTDFSDDITQVPARPQPDGLSDGHTDQVGPRAPGTDRSDDERVPNPAEVRRQLRGDSDRPQAMETVNEDEGDEPGPTTTPTTTTTTTTTTETTTTETTTTSETDEKPATDDTPSTPTAPTSHDRLREQHERVMEEYEESAVGWPRDTSGMWENNPDEVMAPIDADGRPIDGDSGLGDLDLG